MSIDVQRVYDSTGASRSTYFLVDRLWPRGVSKERLKGVMWFRDVAPSNALRKWFDHDPDKWRDFMKRYFKELDGNPESWQPILETAREGSVTLLYGAKDTEHNQAIALKVYLDTKLKHSGIKRD